jgi:hypothetical protein
MEIVEERKIVLTLTLKEAQFLKDFMQNPNRHQDEVEPDDVREMRKIFWKALYDLI